MRWEFWVFDTKTKEDCSGKGGAARFWACGPGRGKAPQGFIKNKQTINEGEGGVSLLELKQTLPRSWMTKDLRESHLRSVCSNEMDRLGFVLLPLRRVRADHLADRHWVGQHPGHQSVAIMRNMKMSISVSNLFRPFVISSTPGSGFPVKSHLDK